MQKSNTFRECAQIDDCKEKYQEKKKDLSKKNIYLLLIIENLEKVIRNKRDFGSWHTR